MMSEVDEQYDDPFSNDPVEEAQAEQVETESTDVEQSASSAETEENQEPQSEPEVKADPHDEVKALKRELARRTQLYNDLKAEREAAPAPDYWEDPEGAVNNVATQLRNEMLKTKLDLSEAYARRAHTDYEDKMDIFADMVQQDPSLYQKAIASQDPAEFAYNIAANHQKIQSYGDMSKFEAAVRAEERKKVEEEYKARFEKELNERSSIPPSLANARSSGGNSAGSWREPTTDELFS